MEKTDYVCCGYPIWTRKILVFQIKNDIAIISLSQLDFDSSIVTTAFLLTYLEFGNHDARIRPLNRTSQGGKEEM